MTEIDQLRAELAAERKRREEAERLEKSLRAQRQGMIDEHNRVTSLIAAERDQLRADQIPYVELSKRLFTERNAERARAEVLVLSRDDAEQRRDAALARATQAEAQCAAMRAFVEENLASQAKAAWKASLIRESDALSAALVEIQGRCPSATAGSALLQRLERAEENERDLEAQLHSMIDAGSAFAERLRLAEAVCEAVSVDTLHRCPGLQDHWKRWRDARKGGE
jgi:hypothetical protein